MAFDGAADKRVSCGANGRVMWRVLTGGKVEVSETVHDTVGAGSVFGETGWSLFIVCWDRYSLDSLASLPFLCHIAAAVLLPSGATRYLLR